MSAADDTVLDHLRRLGVDVDAVAGGPPEPVAERIGRYPVTGRLGAGGMGEVLQVRDDDLRREVAAKIIRGRPRPRQLDKFLLEAQVTGRLAHPNIVPVYELGATREGQLYYTMKRVEGQDLASLLGALDDDAPPPAARRDLLRLLQIFGKVCDAVAYAHSHGVIHRDLKPANVMVGRFGEVLVMDWGLAKILRRAATPWSRRSRSRSRRAAR